MRRLPWLEDFNDRTAAPPGPAAEDTPSPPEDLPDPSVEAWNEGFLAGWRACQANAAVLGRDVAGDITRRVADIERTLAETADASAATMGGLLIDMLTASLPANWPADRLGPIVEVIRPIFALEPRLLIHPGQAGEVSFRDVPELYRALEAGDWDLAVSWYQAGADIDPSYLAAAIKQAIGPAPDETRTERTEP